MLCTLILAIVLSINIQVGLNMHPYDDIGDALSSLRGLISSSYMEILLIAMIGRFIQAIYFITSELRRCVSRVFR